MDAAARDAYNGARSAVLAREEQRRAMDARKRALIEDLEARERGEVPKRMRGANPPTGLSQNELRILHQAGNRRLEERRRAIEEAEARERARLDIPIDRSRSSSRSSSRLSNHMRVDGSPPNRMDGSPPNRMAGSPPQRGVPPPSDAGDAADDEQEDPVIADIQRRIREAKAKKAAKAARKAEKEMAKEAAEKAARASAEGDGAKPPETRPREVQEASEERFVFSGSKADGKKKEFAVYTEAGFNLPSLFNVPSRFTTTSPFTTSTPFTSSTTFTTPSEFPHPSSPTTTEAPSAAPPKPRGNWSSTMERLKAAQAEKERRKAEEEAAKQAEADVDVELGDAEAEVEAEAA